MVAAALETSNERVNLLLVDDRPDGLVALEAVLAGPEYRLVTAHSGREALGHLFDTEFAAILLDVQMPEMDGFETARIIRAREKSRSTPILFVTAINKDQRYVFRGYEVGGVDYLFKPFDPHILRAKVAVFAELFRKEKLLQRQAEALRRSEAHNRMLIETAGDLILTFSAEGMVLSANPAFTKVTGWSMESCLYRSFLSLVHPDDRAWTAQRLQHAQHSPTPLFELRLLGSAGQSIPVEASLLPFESEVVGSGVLACIRDVSARKMAEKEKRRNEELERSNRELEQFAHICSHDLQEPLRQVVNFTQLLARRYRGAIDRDADQYLTHVVEGSTRMSSLVRDLLAYAKLGAEAEMEAIDVAGALGRARDNLRAAITESGSEITVETLPSVKANRIQLVQLLQNLIANAIKFRGDRPLRIRVGAERDGDYWRFFVEDNGMGFEMEYADRIFVIFKRLHGRDRYPGTGIGLAICKRIVERHGGRIWAEAHPNAGATFFFTLPAPSNEAEPSRADESGAIFPDGAAPVPKSPQALT